MKKKFGIFLVLMILLVSTLLIFINLSIIAVPNDESTISNEQEDVQDVSPIEIENADESLEESTLFKDLSLNHWAIEYIETLAMLGIVNGYEDGTFKSENQVKTGEFIKMLSTTYFKDYKYKQPQEGEHWAYQYVVIFKNIISQIDINNYNEAKELEKVISRQEMAQLISHVYSFNNNIKINNNVETNTFNDASNIDTKYVRYVNFCIKYGLLNGFEDNTFRPNEGLTRAQASKVIYKIIYD